MLVGDRHSLKKHQDLVHFNIRNFACEQCPKRFGVAADLRDHVNNVHNKIKASTASVGLFNISVSRLLTYVGFRPISGNHRG